MIKGSKLQFALSSISHIPNTLSFPICAPIYSLLSAERFIPIIFTRGYFPFSRNAPAFMRLNGNALFLMISAIRKLNASLFVYSYLFLTAASCTVI